MRRLTKEHVIYELGRAQAPVFSLDDGETIVVETWDCWGGVLTREGRDPHACGGLNPATGPIEVKGAQPGEGLAVTIHSIAPASWGFIVGGGPGEITIIGAADGGDFTGVEMANGIAHYPWGLELPVDPMIGVIGVAPEGDPVPTTTPHDWGGNIDTVDVRAGSTIFFPVAAPGALLALGDIHALQGDGECGGSGVECMAEVTLTVKRQSEPLWPCPLVLRDDRLMLLASADTVDEAAQKAVVEMTKLLVKLTGLSDAESRRLLSTAGEVRISQIVNPKKTCRAVIPKAAIPGAWPF